MNLGKAARYDHAGARRWLDCYEEALYETLDLSTCEYGHAECSITPDGPCVDEMTLLVEED